MTVHVSVQYQVIREKVYSAYYVLSDLQAQMRAVRVLLSYLHFSSFLCLTNSLYVLTLTCLLLTLQNQQYVFDTIRASLCHMTLDHAFESKEEISSQLKTHLQEIMSNYGFTIINALVTDLSPDSKVRDAMNEINASKRLKEAAFQRAEGEKVVKVKRAEAEAESMYLSGNLPPLSPLYPPFLYPYISTPLW